MTSLLIDIIQEFILQPLKQKYITKRSKEGCKNFIISIYEKNLQIASRHLLHLRASYQNSFFCSAEITLKLSKLLKKKHLLGTKHSKKLDNLFHNNKKNQEIVINKLCLKLSQQYNHNNSSVHLS